MAPMRPSVKIVAVVSSALLVGLYVFDRAGGNLLKKLSLGSSAEKGPTMMSGSKSKSPMIPVTSKSQSPALMPGPKSAPVFAKSTIDDEQLSSAPVAQPPQQKILIHGSKYLSPVIPSPESAPNAPAQKQSATNK